MKRRAHCLLLLFCRESHEKARFYHHPFLWQSIARADGWNGGWLLATGSCSRLMLSRVRFPRIRQKAFILFSPGAGKIAKAPLSRAGASYWVEHNCVYWPSFFLSFLYTTTMVLTMFRINSI